MMLSTLKHATL